MTPAKSCSFAKQQFDLRSATYYHLFFLLLLFSFGIPSGLDRFTRPFLAFEIIAWPQLGQRGGERIVLFFYFFFFLPCSLFFFVYTPYPFSSSVWLSGAGTGFGGTNTGVLVIIVIFTGVFRILDYFYLLSAREYVSDVCFGGFEARWGGGVLDDQKEPGWGGDLLGWGTIGGRRSIYQQAGRWKHLYMGLGSRPQEGNTTLGGLEILVFCSFAAQRDVRMSADVRVEPPRFQSRPRIRRRAEQAASRQVHGASPELPLPSISLSAITRRATDRYSTPEPATL
jgi:hypothetical protein